MRAQNESLEGEISVRAEWESSKGELKKRAQKRELKRRAKKGELKRRAHKESSKEEHRER